MASVVDIFCGAGGLTHGFVQQGFNVVAGIDNDIHCKFPYEHNNDATFIQKSVCEIDPDEIDALFLPNQPRILVGCAPCQPFSNYTHKREYRDKWDLVIKFAELILAIRPQIFSMENVPSLVTYMNRSVYKSFISMLEPHYRIWDEIVFAPDYGVPQKRRRLVVLGSLLGEIELLPRTHTPEDYVDVQTAIGELPPIAAGEVCESDPLHRTRGLSPLNMERMLQSVPGGTWADWDEELRAECHKKSSGRTFSCVYGRMKADSPAPTITTQAFSFGTGRFGHPVQDRALSLREMAIIQSFPMEYKFVREEETDYSFERIGKMIGNAVPVLLAKQIAASVERHLDRHA
ncbi:MAG: DNA cytosine methyltransferase [Chloroflexota bacterium]|nr:DNA cytosine methyltransferase [Chloroflexota bacterium]MDE2947608.1 DNA cytosine methyltransferase [Chloroflexota bacterium]